MKIHIVQSNESLKEIAKKYDIAVEEIIKNNQHISNVHHILPGMILRLPILNEEATDKFRNNTIDIKEYYPTIDDFNQFEQNTSIVKQPKKEDLAYQPIDVTDQDEQQEEQQQEPINQNYNQPPNYAYGQFVGQPLPYGYYYNNQQPYQQNPYFQQANSNNLVPNQQVPYPYPRDENKEGEVKMEERNQNTSRQQVNPYPNVGYANVPNQNAIHNPYQSTYYKPKPITIDLRKKK